MKVDFAASSEDKTGLWLVFPQRGNQRYFVPEDSISCLHPDTRQQVYLYLSKPVGEIERFRLEGVSLEELKPLLSADKFIEFVTDAEDQQCRSGAAHVTALASRTGINALKYEDGVIRRVEVKAACQDQIYGRGNGSYGLRVHKAGEGFDAFAAGAEKPDTYGWCRLPKLAAA